MTENEINRKRRRSLDDVVDSSGLDHKRISSGTDRVGGFGNLMNSTPIARDYSMDHHSSAHSSPFHQGMYLLSKGNFFLRSKSEHALVELYISIQNTKY